MSRRLVVDLAKAHHPDGIGTWQRDVAKALVASGERPIGVTLQPTDRDAVRTALGAEADGIEWADSVDPSGVLITSAWVLPVGYRGPSLFIVHDLTFLDLPECHTVDNRLHCAEGFLRAAFDPMARLVAVSEATAAAVRNWFGDRIDVAVVHNGVAEHFRPVAGAAERVGRHFGLSTSHDAGFVLAVGSLEPRKNLDRLLEAHGQLPDETRRRFPLAVASGGGWRNQGLVARLEQQDHVRHLQELDLEGLRDLYSAATVFAYPSLAEGFGLPVAEAMACGAPVITSDRSSLPEVAGDAALLVDPTDTGAIHTALARLLSDPVCRQALAERGPARASRFTWRRTAERLIRLAATAA